MLANDVTNPMKMTDTNLQKPGSRIAIPQRKTPSPVKSRLPVAGAPKLLQERSSSTTSSITSFNLRKPIRLAQKDATPVVPTERSRLREPSTTSAAKASRLAQPEQKDTGASSRQGFSYSRETLDPRLELLHAHVIHRNSQATEEEWKASARRHYQKRFKVLQDRSKELDEKEIAHLEQKNAGALIDWGNQKDGMTLDQKIHKVSSILDQVWRLSAAEGQYTHAIQAFEHWLLAAEGVRQRRKAGKDARARFGVVEGLGDGWKAEVQSLHDSLVEAASDIMALCEIFADSSDIQRCILVTTEALTHMLEELELITSIEEQMTADEQTWVKGSINDIAAGLKDGLALAQSF